MIEKGLTMRPRRDTFAVAYIGMIIDRLSRALEAGALDSLTLAWARDVLDAYFEATSTSTNPAIASARETYATLNVSSELPYVGPSPLGSTPGGVAIEDLAQLAASRRSVRWYNDRAVDREIVDQSIEIALESPTACNRVPYRFRIFDSPDDARAIASIAGGTSGYVHNLQSLVVLVGDLSAYVEERDRHLIYIDGSLAAMSFLLAMQSNGVSTCCINWPDIAVPERQLADLIGLRRHERVVMLIAYGYGDPTGLAPASPKFPLSRARQFERLEK